MNQKTDKQIKERIDDAGLAELMPDFDWDQTWQQIGDKMEPRRILKWQRVLPYAAILLLGLFIAGWISFHGNGEQQQVTAVRRLATPAPAMPVTGQIPVIADNDTAAVTALPPDHTARLIKQESSVAIPVHPEESPETIPAVPAPVPVTGETLPVANTAAVRKVKHYLDIDAGTEQKKDIPRPVAAAPVSRKVKHFLDIDQKDHRMMNPQYQLADARILKFRINTPAKTVTPHNPAELPLRTFIYATTN